MCNSLRLWRNWHLVYITEGQTMTVDVQATRVSKSRRRTKKERKKRKRSVRDFLFMMSSGVLVFPLLNRKDSAHAETAQFRQEYYISIWGIFFLFSPGSFLLLFFLPYNNHMVDDENNGYMIGRDWLLLGAWSHFNHPWGHFCYLFWGILFWAWPATRTSLDISAMSFLLGG